MKMAKRYIRINWQNRPSVATPLSAANLNKMDKGIDDIDNAIEEIYNKRVNNVVTTNPDTFLAGPVGKTLQDQITELNNNLDDLKVARGYANESGLLMSAPTSVDEMTETGIYKLDNSTPGMPPGTGVYTAVVEVIKASTTVVLQRLTIVYTSTGTPSVGTVYTRVLIGDSPGEWEAK